MKNKTMRTSFSTDNEDRVLDGPLLIFDLPVLMKKIKQEDSWQNGQRNAITLLKSDNMRLVLIALRAGEEIDFRQSDNLISLQLLEGNSEFRAVNKTVELKQGNLITLHENMEHSLIAISETIFLLTIGNGDMQTE
jgi:quercetin dioxygenase-like cupin family protein